ncbi:hypothetical protein V5799_031233 [Amblyomma americanum]|uniref:Uncharacterized protein n=1 Tax=Amblyomma americanum TaxID=6943 RepID=A0AAQ4ELX0_AMBAM
MEYAVEGEDITLAQFAEGGWKTVLNLQERYRRPRAKNAVHGNADPTNTPATPGKEHSTASGVPRNEVNVHPGDFLRQKGSRHHLLMGESFSRAPVQGAGRNLFQLQKSRSLGGRLLQTQDPTVQAFLIYCLKPRAWLLGHNSWW